MESRLLVVEDVGELETGEGGGVLMAREEEDTHLYVLKYYYWYYSTNFLMKIPNNSVC